MSEETQPTSKDNWCANCGHDCHCDSEACLCNCKECKCKNMYTDSDKIKTVQRWQ